MSDTRESVSRGVGEDSVDLKGNTMTLNLSYITLDGVGRLVGILNEQPIVVNVGVPAASWQNE